MSKGEGGREAGREGSVNKHPRELSFLEQRCVSVRRPTWVIAAAAKNKRFSRRC